MAAQVDLSLTWSQTPKTGFLVTRLNLIRKTGAVEDQTSDPWIARLAH